VTDFFPLKINSFGSPELPKLPEFPQLPKPSPLLVFKGEELLYSFPPFICSFMFPSVATMLKAFSFAHSMFSFRCLVGGGAQKQQKGSVAIFVRFFSLKKTGTTAPHKMVIYWFR